MSLSDVLNLKTILAAILVVSVCNKSFFALLIGVRNGMENLIEKLFKKEQSD